MSNGNFRQFLFFFSQKSYEGTVHLCGSYGQYVYIQYIKTFVNYFVINVNSNYFFRAIAEWLMENFPETRSIRDNVSHFLGPIHSGDGG
jgi:hypothetical protein